VRNTPNYQFSIHPQRRSTDVERAGFGALLEPRPDHGHGHRVIVFKVLDLEEGAVAVERKKS
jgi:hypothetical protein